MTHQTNKHDLNNRLVTNDNLLTINSEHALQKELISRIKLYMEAEYVVLYLYSPVSSDFELVQVSTRKTNQFKRFLYKDKVINKDVTDDKKIVIHNGDQALHSLTTSINYLIPIQQDQSIIGYMLLGYSKGKIKTKEFEKRCKFICKESYSLLNNTKTHLQTKEQANKYELMYRVTQKLNSSMNPSDVLEEIVNTIQSIYPYFTCNLFLSRNYKNERKLPVKELNYNDKYVEKQSIQAFLTGEMRQEQNIEKNKSYLFAPLRGKQGIYGVLQIKVKQLIQFDDDAIDFFRILADSAGNALENAQLYEQSTQLISDLQLINEITHRLNANLRLADTANFLKEQLKTSFEVEDIGFILFQDDSTDYVLLQQSSDCFHSDLLDTLARDIFPVIKKQKEAIFVGDFEKKYPQIHTKLKSVMMMPMIQSEELKGIVILLNHQPNFFSFDDFKLIRSIVQHSTLAFVNSQLREQLEQSLITDYLTKLYARRFLDEKCEYHLENDERGVFLLIDIDDFKNINDTYGHEMGDKLLVQVSHILRECTEEIGFAARWGGEELAVYLPELTTEAGMKIASHLVIDVEEKTNPSITISIGMACWNRYRPINMQQLFDQADRSLYEAKRLGKNGVVKIN
ncbi:hypothetical protein Pryu01_01398 [Paraliobacillus ryukyuensis]|uniref:Diguanylate cyclase with GAF sensor n=1 Tax=Paraliobacillus ryukyuensis TaxID=200904 RepID=A0A366EAB8_9BACI|nr:diguanylate cyclase [Paraliobacillus ryukyuensis]RBO99370.1 diguanylate cyclase with GAF sensor [Paraliobacillus ryukyuensis]